ncbi:hypothetical protein SUGI_0793630 [Cryptomeria japonica]|nr:hypothetical protein SUGI_0793630 [Cryptomeria japonica]
MMSEAQRTSEAQRVCEVQKGCEMQKKVCEEKRVSYNGRSREDEAQPKTTEETSIPDQMSIDLKDEVVDEKCIWEDLAIISRIIGLKQPRRYIMPWVEKNWGSHAMVKYLPKGFFVTIFAEKEDRDQALNSKNWCFENFLLYIQPWTPNFDPLKLAVYDSPVWIRLFNLLIEYWGDPCLQKIGRSLGTLLEIDEDIIDNDSYVYARMRIATVK